MSQDLYLVWSIRNVRIKESLTGLLIKMLRLQDTSHKSEPTFLDGLDDVVDVVGPLAHQSPHPNDSNGVLRRKLTLFAVNEQVASYDQQLCELDVRTKPKISKPSGRD